MPSKPMARASPDMAMKIICSMTSETVSMPSPMVLKPFNSPSTRGAVSAATPNPSDHLPKLVLGSKKDKNARSAETTADQIFFNICNNEESAVRMLFRMHYITGEMMKV